MPGAVPEDFKAPHWVKPDAACPGTWLDEEMIEIIRARHNGASAGRMDAAATTSINSHRLDSLEHAKLLVAIAASAKNEQMRQEVLHCWKWSF